MPASTHRERVERARPNRLQTVGLLLGAVVFVVPLLVDIPDLAPAGQRMLAISLLAIVLWVTEAIPLVATAVLVILLEVLMVPDQALVAVAGDTLAADAYFAALADPVIMLFLGGFLIADGANKFSLDRNLAGVMLRPFAVGHAARSWGGWRSPRCSRCSSRTPRRRRRCSPSSCRSWPRCPPVPPAPVWRWPSGGGQRGRHRHTGR